MGEVLDVACADDADDVDVAGDREEEVFAVWDLTTIGEVLDGAFAPTSLLSNLLIFDIYYINIYFLFFVTATRAKYFTFFFFVTRRFFLGARGFDAFFKHNNWYMKIHKKKKSSRLIGRC